MPQFSRKLQRNSKTAVQFADKKFTEVWREMNNKNQVAIILGVCGTLFFIASGLGVLPWKFAVFGGIACYIIAGAVKKSAN
jgi:hypothetical protein